VSTWKDLYIGLVGAVAAYDQALRRWAWVADSDEHGDAWVGHSDELDELWAAVLSAAGIAPQTQSDPA